MESRKLKNSKKCKCAENFFLKSVMIFGIFFLKSVSALESFSKNKVVFLEIFMIKYDNRIVMFSSDRF